MESLRHHHWHHQLRRLRHHRFWKRHDDDFNQNRQSNLLTSHHLFSMSSSTHPSSSVPGRDQLKVSGAHHEGLSLANRQHSTSPSPLSSSSISRHRILGIILSSFILLISISSIHSAITESCLRCICHASSGCDSTLRCHNTGDGGYFCGPYQISWAYWSDAGKMGSRGGDQDFETCLNNQVCAEATIVSYMNKYASDCNKDGVIDCNDFAAIHKAGPHSCNADWFMSSDYWRKYQATDCYNPRTNPNRSSRDFFLEEVVPRPQPPPNNNNLRPSSPGGQNNRRRLNNQPRPQGRNNDFTTISPTNNRFVTHPPPPPPPPYIDDIPRTRTSPSIPDRQGPPRHSNFDQPPHVTHHPFNGSSSEHNIFHALPDANDGGFNFNAFRFPSPIEEFHGGFFEPPSPSVTTDFSRNDFRGVDNFESSRRPPINDRRRIEGNFENFNNNNNRPRNGGSPFRDVSPPVNSRPFADEPPRGPPPVVPRGSPNPPRPPQPPFTNSPPPIVNTSPRGVLQPTSPPSVIFPPGNSGRNHHPGGRRQQGPPPLIRNGNVGPESRALQPFNGPPNRGPPFTPSSSVRPPPVNTHPSTISSPLIPTNRRQPSATGIVPASCLPCLCSASSGCDLNKKCVGDFCGPYLISWSYWRDGGQPGKDFVSCALDVSCAEQAIQGYMKKWTRDCNGDGIVDCDDFAAIHKLGPHQCRSEDIVNTPYWREYEKCGARGGLGSSSTAVSDLRRPERGFNDIPAVDNSWNDNNGLSPPPPPPPIFFGNPNHPPTTPRPALDLPLITPRRRLYAPSRDVTHDGENNSVEPVTTKPIVVDMSLECMECICDASSGCNFDIHCSEGGPDAPPSCGPFQMDHNYWRTAGRPGYRGDNRIDFERCASEKECAEETVKRFIRRVSFDCNEDGVIDCLDYAAIHRAGPKGCNSQWFLESKYWSSFEQCFGFSARRR